MPSPLIDRVPPKATLARVDRGRRYKVLGHPYSYMGLDPFGLHRFADGLETIALADGRLSWMLKLGQIVPDGPPPGVDVLPTD